MRRLVLAFVFLLGAVAGLAFERVLRRLMPFPPDPADVERTLSRDLSLDDAQRAKVHLILLETDARIRALHEKTRADFDAEIAATQQKIDTVLRPEQKAKADAAKARWDKRRNEPPGLFGPSLLYP